ncbi:MAG: hypothetical protein HYZ20_20030 [Burkholderiales bacterium]|nr:hypothetical protein [Burkholderiales bacterium]
MPLSDAIDRIWLPGMELSRCVRAVLSRDTRHCRLDSRQRLAYTPMSPLCTISWRFVGSSERLDGIVGDPALVARQPLRMRFHLGGPRTAAQTWWNPGPVHLMRVAMMPDALRALTGVEPQQLVDRDVDAAEFLPLDWQPWLHAVQDADDDDTRVALIESFLLPRRRARPEPRSGRPLHAASKARSAPASRPVSLNMVSPAASREE